MEVTGQTRLVGIIGHPVAHTLSPVLHNAAFREMGMDWCYLPFDVHPRKLHAALAGLAALGCRGLNVTIPHKQAVLQDLTGLTREARLIGAVNTIEFRGSKRIGHNTDGRGFAMAVRQEWGETLSGKRILLLGAGGAARAVAVQLMIEGVDRLIIANRTMKKAKRLTELLGRRFRSEKIAAMPLTKDRLSAALENIQVVINATSVGMGSDPKSPLPTGLLHPDLRVCDLIYQPLMTPFLRDAQAVGARILNGVGMLLWQGVLAFEIWTGKRPPVEVMKRALMEALASQP
jgi:shikimate dehydrogenase